MVAQRLLRSAVHSVTRHVRHTSVSAGDGAHGAVKQEPGAGGDVAEEMRLLLQAIACPVTKKPLRYDSARQVWSNFPSTSPLFPPTLFCVEGADSPFVAPDLTERAPSALHPSFPPPWSTTQSLIPSWPAPQLTFPQRTTAQAATDLPASIDWLSKRSCVLSK